MKKLPLFMATLFVVAKINLIAGGPGETIRNSPTNPNARKQQLSNTTEESKNGRPYTKSQLKKMLAEKRILAATAAANQATNS